MGENEMKSKVKSQRVTFRNSPKDETVEADDVKVDSVDDSGPNTQVEITVEGDIPLNLTTPGWEVIVTLPDELDGTHSGFVREQDSTGGEHSLLIDVTG